MSSSASNLKKIQALSGLVMAIYATMHLSNHYVLNVSYESADDVMMKLRKIYQHPLLEGSFLVALVVHFSANYQLYQRRAKLESSSTTGRSKKYDDATTSTEKSATVIAPELKAHRWAGYILSLLVVAHVVAVRVTPLVYFDNPSDFDYSFAAAAISFFPYHSFTVYYIVLGMAGGWHLIYGVRAALATLQGTSVIGRTFPLPLKMVAATSHVLIVGAVLALGAYSTSIPWSETKLALHDHFFKSMGM